MAAGLILQEAGLCWGLSPDEAAVGSADRLVCEELVVLGKLSPSPRSSSSGGGEALLLVMPA